MKLAGIAAAAALTIIVTTGSGLAAPDKPECLVGAKPGGGFDLTCRIAAQALVASKLIEKPVAVNYMEGGVGIVAMGHVIGTRPAEPGLLVAASSGTGLLLAQKKFGNADENSVRWVAAVGADYGAIAVATNSPIKSLKELVEAIKKNPAEFPSGGGGAVGSQDWLKLAMVFKAAGQDPKGMRYVAVEGGGTVLTQLQGGFIKIGASEASEFAPHHKAGRVRILAVLSESRLPGDLADVPTAKEQGFDIDWTVWRGFYVGPKVSDADYQWWADTFTKLHKTPEFKKELDARGLFPLDLAGKPFEDKVKADVRRLRDLAKAVGL